MGRTERLLVLWIVAWAGVYWWAPAASTHTGVVNRLAWCSWQQGRQTIEKSLPVPIAADIAQRVGCRAGPDLTELVLSIREGVVVNASTSPTVACVENQAVGELARAMVTAMKVESMRCHVTIPLGQP